jgi:protease-4
LKQFLITVAGVLVGLILFLIIAPMVLIGSISSSMSRDAEARSPGAIVLGIDMRDGMTDSPSTSPFSFSQGDSVVEMVRTLEAAAKDSKVKGVFVRAATSGMAPAHAEEMRAALNAFRASSGKWVIAHIQNEGIRTSIAGYAAIAGADEVWLQDASEMMPMGIVAEETFFADTLKRFKMDAEFVTREEYKTAADTLTQRGYTPANRESTETLLNGIYTQMLAAIAEDRKGRGLTPDLVKAAIEATPYAGEEALSRKLVDKLGRPEDAMQVAIEKAGGEDKAEIVDISDYHAKPGTGPVLALVSGEGPIVGDSGGGGSPFGDEPMMVGDDIAEAITEAAKDKDVKAIVFRVSSPGGSVVASDQIWHAVENAQKAGKKVVVSMGAYAASGGYYVSAGADEIVANPTTITGSIGVVGGKLIVGPALQNYLSARTETIQVGSPVANFFSGDRRMNQAERAAFEGFIDRAYQDFLGLVAEGRGMPKEQVRELAKGRVWTGAQAHERKLVNTLGGLSVAVARAKALAGIDEKTAVQLRLYPKQPSPFEALEELFGASAAQARTAAVLATVMGDERVEGLLREALREREAARSEMSLTVE